MVLCASSCSSNKAKTCNRLANNVSIKNLFYYKYKTMLSERKKKYSKEPVNSYKYLGRAVTEEIICSKYTIKIRKHLTDREKCYADL